MTRLLHPLFLLLAPATEHELARMAAFLKAENRILRDEPRVLEAIDLLELVRAARAVAVLEEFAATP